MKNLFICSLVREIKTTGDKLEDLIKEYELTEQEIAEINEMLNRDNQNDQ